MSPTPILAPDAPEPIGPYSAAIRDEQAGLIFCSGQTPVDPATGRLIDGDVTAQTRQAFSNLHHVLTSAGASWADVVKVNVYLTTMADFAAMNEAYGATFTPPYPARTTVAVAELPLGARVEIELMARCPQ